MEVEFGKEALKFENGAFSYFGVPAIMPAGTDKPEHTLTQHSLVPSCSSSISSFLVSCSIDIISTSTATMMTPSSTESMTQFGKVDVD